MTKDNLNSLTRVTHDRARDTKFCQLLILLVENTFLKEESHELDSELVSDPTDSDLTRAKKN